MQASADAAPSAPVAIAGKTTLVDWMHEHRALLGVLAAAFASRAFFFIIATVSVGTVDQWPPGTWHRGPSWVQPFARWDSGYYLDIAQVGYGTAPHFWAFHPAYPLAIRWTAGALPGISIEVAGFLISNACFFAAILVYFRWTRELLGDRVAVVSAALLSWFPTAFFFSAVYTESMFFLLLVLSLWSFQTKRWIAAGLLATLANAVRPQGLFLGPAFALVLAWEWWRGPRPPWRAWAAPALTPLFAVAFSWFAWRQTGDPLYWVHARERAWPDVGWHDPFQSIGRAFDIPDNYGLPLIGLVLLTAATMYGIRQLRQDPTGPTRTVHVFTAILFVVHILYSGSPSLLRYSMAALSIPWMFAAFATTPRRFALLLVPSAIVGGFVAFLFATWRPAL